MDRVDRVGGGQRYDVWSEKTSKVHKCKVS